MTYATLENGQTYHTNFKSPNIVFQSIEWFLENAYQDSSGDFWEDYNTYSIYLVSEGDKALDICVSQYILNQNSMYYADEYAISVYGWCIKERISQETHPEYFI